MPDLPASLALTSIATSSQILSADHRNNYAAIQTAVNALTAALGGGTSKQILQATDADTIAWAGAYTAYTPIWTSTGTAPALNNGASAGRYIQVGKIVHYWGSLAFGSTTTFGTGTYLISFPVLPNQTRALGWVDMSDSSTSGRAWALAEPVGATPGATTFAMNYPATWPGGTNTGVGQTTPWTWAQGDFIAWGLTYEAQ